MVSLVGGPATANAADTPTAESISADCYGVSNGGTGIAPGHIECQIAVGYTDGTVETRLWQSNVESSPLPTGVVLNGGYSPVVACGTYANGMPTSSQGDCQTFGLKNRPVSSSTIAYTPPTSGAPDGLSTVGIAALSIALLGIGTLIYRRRATA